MDHQNHVHESGADQAGSFLAGLLLGSLAGAGAMLLLAPQSGKQTRTQIQAKGIELRDQTAETVDEALGQARNKARQINASVHEQAGDLQQRGTELLDEQRVRLASAVEAGKSALKGAQAPTTERR